MKNSNPLQLNAIIYTRVASHLQADIDNASMCQKKLCLSQAKKHQLNIVQTFQGTGNGKDSICEVLSFIKEEKNPKISYIIVSAPDRLSRNFEFYTQLLSELNKLGVGVISATGSNEILKPSESLTVYLFDSLFKKIDKESNNSIGLK